MATIEGEEDLYEILGVASTANQAEIQAAFKRRARELHPDVSKAPDAEEQFKRLNAAYAILKDEGKRARYDAFGLGGSRGRRSHSKRNRPPTPRAHRPGPRPGPFGNGVRFEDVNTETEDLKNPFDFFLRRERAKRAKSNSDREVQLAIPLKHAYTGTTLNISVDLPGKNGLETKKLRIKIPKGAKEGDRLKLKDPSIVVVLTFEEDDRFEIDGRDVTMALEVTPWEAALGETIEFDAPGGLLKVKIPEGSSSGRRLRLRGQGLPQKPGRDGAAGDLYMMLSLVLPATTSEEERSLWKRLAKVTRFKPRK